MELQIISDSISALSSTKALIAKIQNLEMELVNANALFSSFRIKVKESIYLKCKSYEDRITSLNHRIEELEMVSDK